VSDPTHSADYQRALAALSDRGPGRMVPDLSRITELAGLLGDPQLAYPSVHVTGTNGKGSVVRMVGALCSAAGLTAGTYTSPHLQTVRERLSLAGRHIPEARFAELHDEVATLAQLVDDATRERDGDDADRITYFEQLTAMAYWWFADAPVDVGVFEVGMGGRWDATNLVRGDVAVLNEIDVDHPELGATPIEVAAEKVGIVKPGAHVVTAAQDEQVREVVDAAVAEADATLWAVGRDLAVVDRRIAVGGQLLTLRVGDRTVDEILLPLFGEHQARNAVLALGAFAALTGEAFAGMEDDVVRHGLGAVTVPGRLEIARREPTVVLDGAHNPHGSAAVARALGESFDFRDLVLVAACLEGKDVEGILRPFRDLASHVVVTRAPSPRSVPATVMGDTAVGVWSGTGVAVEVADTLPAALDLAEGIAGEGDGVLVVGSLHTVGGARDRYLPVVDLDDEVVYAPDDDPDAPDDISGEAGEDLDRSGLEELLHDEEAFDEAMRRLLDGDLDDDG
jgi:dihydrofolate synthase / folylpolyglutamate synthase